MHRHRRRPRCRPRSSTRSRADAWRPSCAPTVTTTTSTPPATLADSVRAPIVIHPDDRMLWDVVYPDRAPDGAVIDGSRFEVGGTELVALHTPGHSPGGVSLYESAADRVFSGDTLFHGGPGATGRSFSSRETIMSSIRDRLLILPPRTVVHTGHGPDTTIGDEPRPSNRTGAPGLRRSSRRCELRRTGRRGS